MSNSKITTIFLRKKRIGENSMEMLLKSLLPFLKNVRILELPSYSTSIKGIINNIRYVLKNKSDVNHIYSIMDGYLAIFLKNSIITIHDLDNLNGLKLQSKCILYFISVFLPSIKVKKYHCISNYTKQRLIKCLPWRSRSVEVIHNPLNPIFKEGYERKSYSQDHVIILQIGTGKRKHLETVIKAISNIDDLNIELHIVGLLSSNQIKLLEDNRINYLSYVDIPTDELKRLYQQAHIVTFPSSAEGFGMIIIEANACGVPIIAGDIPVLKEVGQDAMLYVDPEDSESLGNYIEDLLRDNELRNRLISNGKKNIDRFQIQFIAQCYNKLYDSVK